MSLLEDLRRQLDAMPPAPPRLIENDAAVIMRQRKRYPRRRAKSEAHFQRMNKKWLKRYGTYPEPAAFHTRMPRLFGPGEEVIMIHPILMAKYKQLFAAADLAGPGGDRTSVTVWGRDGRGTLHMLGESNG